MAIAGVEAKSAKGHEETATGGGFELFGDFATTPEGIRTHGVSTNSKTKNLLKILRGAYAWNKRVVLKLPSGFGLENFTFVVDEPDAFI